MIHPDDEIYLRIQRNNKLLRRWTLIIIAVLAAANLVDVVRQFAGL